MKRNNGSPSVILLFAALLFLVPDNAFAYIDPQAGSVVFQVVVASIVVSLFSIKTFLRRIRDFITRRKSNG